MDSNCGYPVKIFSCFNSCEWSFLYEYFWATSRLNYLTTNRFSVTTIFVVPLYCTFVLYIYYLYNFSLCYKTQSASLPTRLQKYSKSSQVTDIPKTERQRLKDDNSSTSLMFFRLPLDIGPDDRVPAFYIIVQATMCLYLGMNPSVLCS